MSTISILCETQPLATQLISGEGDLSLSLLGAEKLNEIWKKVRGGELNEREDHLRAHKQLTSHTLARNLIYSVIPPSYSADDVFLQCSKIAS